MKLRLLKSEEIENFARDLLGNFTTLVLGGVSFENKYDSVI